MLAGGLVSILVLTALLGAGAAIAGPAEAALVPATVDEDRLAKANGWVETARYAGFTAGPLLAGLLTALGGTGLGLAANAASFAAVALAAALLHARRHAADPSPHAATTAGLRGPSTALNASTGGVPPALCRGWSTGCGCCWTIRSCGPPWSPRWPRWS